MVAIMEASETRAPASRKPARKEARPVLKPNQAVGRDGKILSRHSDESINPFDLPEHFVREINAEGFTLEWKRQSTYNQEDRSYISGLMAQGWTHVPASRYPGRYGSNDQGAIEHKGMVLMERPTSMTEDARYEEKRKASDQLVMKERSWGVEFKNKSMFDPNTPKAREHTLLRKTYEGVDPSTYPHLEIAGDE